MCQKTGFEDDLTMLGFQKWSKSHCLEAYRAETIEYRVFKRATLTYGRFTSNLSINFTFRFS